MRKSRAEQYWNCPLFLTIGKGVGFRVDRDFHALSDSQDVPPQFTNWPAMVLKQHQPFKRRGLEAHGLMADLRPSYE